MLNKLLVRLGKCFKVSKIEPELKEEVIKEIEEARKEIKEGKGIPIEKIAKEFDIKLKK